jgi:hypothetical protein
MMSRLPSIIIFLSIGLSPIIEQESFRLGVTGKEGELIIPLQITEGPDGNIYVYDAGDAFIKVYSPLGKFLSKIGGEGQGPGEIQRRGGVSFGFTSDGRLFFAESFGGHRWITLMELSGELHKVLKLELTESFGVLGAVSLPEGGYLVECYFSHQPEKQRDYYLYKARIAILRLDDAGKVISEVTKTVFFDRISFRPSSGDTQLAFSPNVSWCLGKDGHSLVFSDGQSTTLLVYDLSGKLIKEIKTQLPKPERVRRRDLDSWREDLKRAIREKDPDWYQRSGRVIEKYTKSIYKKKPLIENMFSTPEGNILISGAKDNERSPTRYWLLDGDGRILLTMSSAFVIAGVTKDFIFYTVQDEMMNVAVRCIRRTGKENDDLLRVEADYKNVTRRTSLER